MSPGLTRPPPVSIPPMVEPDEPLTPAGRLFLRRKLDTIIHCAIGWEHHMEVEALKSSIKSSLMLKHPRFSSLLVKHGSREFWHKTQVDIDRHVILVDPTTPTNCDDDDDVEKLVNDYIAELSVSTPLATDKPLWEIHVMLAQRCAVFRIHHALGDGISLMSMLLANCRKADDPFALPTYGSITTEDSEGNNDNNRRRRRSRWTFLGFVRAACFSVFFCLEFVLKCLWLRDRRTAVAGGDGVELMPRRIATAKFCIQDMKVVKSVIAGALLKWWLFLLDG